MVPRDSDAASSLRSSASQWRSGWGPGAGPLDLKQGPRITWYLDSDEASSQCRLVSHSGAGGSLKALGVGPQDLEPGSGHLLLCRDPLWGHWGVRDSDGASLQRSIEHRAGAASSANWGFALCALCALCALFVHYVAVFVLFQRTHPRSQEQVSSVLEPAF